MLNTQFCERLRVLRESESRTQADMADILNVNRSTFGAYERGTILPPMDKIEALADHFRVSVDYLMGKTDHKHREEPAAIDVSLQIQRSIEILQDRRTAMVLDGDIMDHDARSMLAASLESGLKMVRILSNALEDREGAK